MAPNTQQELTPPKKEPNPTSSQMEPQQVKDSPVETPVVEQSPQSSGIKEITIPKEVTVQKTGKKKSDQPKIGKDTKTGEITIS